MLEAADFLDFLGSLVFQVPWVLWVQLDLMELTVFMVFLVPEVHLERKEDLYLGRKEKRGIRVCRALRGRLRKSTLQRNSTSKGRRVCRGSKVPVESRVCLVGIPFQGSKERRELWDFLESGAILVSLDFLASKD